MPLVAAARWLGVIVAGGTVIAGVIASLTYVFATKNELINIEKRQVEAEVKTELRDYRIQRLEVQVENVENIATRTDTNVEQLLLMRRARPAPRPVLKPLPDIPSTDTLRKAEK